MVFQHFCGKSVQTPPHFHCMPTELMQTKKCYVFNTSSNLIQLHKCTFCINTKRTPHKFCELESQFISRTAWDNLDNHGFLSFFKRKKSFASIKLSWALLMSGIRLLLVLFWQHQHFTHFADFPQPLQRKIFFRILYSNHEQPNHQFEQKKNRKCNLPRAKWSSVVSFEQFMFMRKMEKVHQANGRSWARRCVRKFVLQNECQVQWNASNKIAKTATAAGKLRARIVCVFQSMW